MILDGLRCTQMSMWFMAVKTIQTSILASGEEIISIGTLKWPKMPNIKIGILNVCREGITYYSLFSR